MQKCNEKTGKGESAPRSRWLEVVTYPGEEADRVEAAVEQLVDTLGCEWVSILHDHDVKAGGELKEAHIHTLMRFPHAHTVTAIAKKLGVTAERVETKDNGEGAEAYLLHETDKARMEGKYVYPPEALRGPLAAEAAAAAEAARGRADEGRQVLDILDWIEGKEGYVSLTGLARWAAQQGRWSAFRRAGVIFKGIVEEHNEAEAEAAERAREEARKKTLAEALDVKPGGDPQHFKKLQAIRLLGELGVEL